MCLCGRWVPQTTSSTPSFEGERKEKAQKLEIKQLFKKAVVLSGHEILASRFPSLGGVGNSAVGTKSSAPL